MPRLSFSPLDNAGRTFLQAFWKHSMSASCVLQPILTRNAARVNESEQAIAASTWEGWTFPEEQAAPEDTAAPSISSAIIAVSALTPATAKSVVFGSRGASAPKITVCGAI